MMCLFRVYISSTHIRPRGAQPSVYSAHWGSFKSRFSSGTFMMSLQIISSLKEQNANGNIMEGMC